MTGRKSLEPRIAAAGMAAAVLFCGSPGVASAATYIVPSIGAVAAWTDNIDLAPPGQEKSGELWDVEPGLSLTHDSLREHATLDYTLHALFINGGHHEFLHSGSLVSVTQIIPTWFELDIAGQRSQGVADPAAPANLEYLFPLGNLANFTSGLVKPIVKHVFGNVQVQASYTRGITDNGAIGGQSALQYRSNERGADFTANSIDQNARLTWNVSYRREQEDYESPYNLHYLYETANGELGLLTIPTLRVIGRGGSESDPQNGISQGGLESTYWAAGFDWSTDKRNELRLLVGHRYFGRTYDALWRHESRLLRLQVNYTEQPTTQDAQMLQQPLAAPPIVIIPGTLGFTRLSPDVYLDKLLTGTAAITGRLTEIGLSISSEERTYYAIATARLIITPRRHLPVVLGGTSLAAQSGSYDDRERSATLYATRHLGPLMDLQLNATYGKFDLREGADAQYDTQEFSAVFTRRFGRRSSWYLRADHIKQYGQIAEYKTNVVSLGINAYFGNPPPGASGNSQNFGSLINHGP